MSEEITKQRFNAKAEIAASEIEETDIGIMTHQPNNADGGDRKFKFSTLANWIKSKIWVQSDWNEEDTEADDYIKNKPAISTIDDTQTSEDTAWSSSKITSNLNDSLAKYGTITNTTVNDVTIPADGTLTTICSVSLEAGTYILKGRMNKNSGTIERMYLYSGSSENDVQDFNGKIIDHLTGFVKLTTTTTIYLKARAWEDCNYSGRLQTIRVG